MKRNRDTNKSIEDSPSPNNETKKVSLRDTNSAEKMSTMDEATFRKIIGEELDKKLVSVIGLVPQVKQISTDIISIKQRLDNLERENRKRNIVINGLPEIANENIQNRVTLVKDLTVKLGLSGTDFEEVRRLGRPGLSNPGRTRPLLVKLVKMNDKIAIMKSKAKLKGTKIYIDDHLTPEEQRKHAILRKKLKELIVEDATTNGFVRYGTLTAWMSGQRKVWYVNTDLEAEEATSMSNP
jgi:hypothetical protein